MKPWREIAIPHSDVLKGTFQQAEFAADLTAVRTGKAPIVYQDAKAFFNRTFITEGMRLLLTQVAQRLAGGDGEPVIQLQTAFGGGKTHTLLAVWHLATRTSPLSELAGIPKLVERAGLMDVPPARVVVLDGTAHSPGQPWKEASTPINTLWGELAWQLGGAEGFAIVREADGNGTSPGKTLLRRLLETYAPCVLLVDELVAYVRQFRDGQKLSGGTYDSNLSFVQALTEAVSLVPTAVMLASLPESELEAGSTSGGVAALQALEKTFGRKQALWKSVSTEEAFEIVRRRLFEPIKDEPSRDAVCRAFADTYVTEGAAVPSETQESRYYERLRQAYPIHPEFFDRLYEDWSTIEGFQRTRGVLKLMAKVIHRLWSGGNHDLMILPGSIPLAESDVRNELTYHLPNGWDPVIERDIDGPRAETTELETKEARFGQAQAARRVARTLFLGTAPSSTSIKHGTRGLDRARVLLGCLQPGQSAAVFTDALSRLADRLHYLSCTGDKTVESTRFWFDTRANLRREMEDRKRRFDEQTEVRKKIQDVAKKVFSDGSLFGGVHVFTPHADVPDDGELRLVLLPPERRYTRDLRRDAEETVHTYLRQHGTQPRHRANRLLFLAADNAVMTRLIEGTRIALAWKSIEEDIDATRLNVDLVQRKQAQKEAQAAAEFLPRIARECFKWLLCPLQDDPADPTPTIEAHAVNTSSGTASGEVARVCREHELVIETWAPVHLRAELKRLYWKDDRVAVEAKTFWEDSLRYLYLPRLKDEKVYQRALLAGAASSDFYGCAIAAKAGGYEGFTFGSSVLQYHKNMLLIEPEAARAYEAQLEAEKDVYRILVPGVAPTAIGPSAQVPSENNLVPLTGGGVRLLPSDPAPIPVTLPPVGKKTRFIGVVKVNPYTAKSQFSDIANEIVKHFTDRPSLEVTLSVDISVTTSEAGFDDALLHTISENCGTLNFNVAEFE